MKVLLHLGKIPTTFKPNTIGHNLGLLVVDLRCVDYLGRQLGHESGQF